MSSPRRRRVASALPLAFSLAAVTGGCISRPVTSQQPETKTNFTSRQKQTAVDKIDLLFAIDNSASMGDKQQLLSEAVPDLLARLLTRATRASSGPRRTATTRAPSLPSTSRI
jgi:hypothetical protein